MSGECLVADLGPVGVSLVTGYAGLARYLGSSYRLVPRGGHVAAGWTIEARLAIPEPGMVLTPWGSGCRADREARRALVCSASPGGLAATVGEVIREVLVAYCEEHGYTMLRASAVTDGRRVVIVAGGKGSGKTTLALSAVAGGGYEMLADGHLILYRGGDGLMATSLPEPVRIPAGPGGEPQGAAGAGILGRVQPPVRGRCGGARHVLLDGRDVTVVLARFAPEGEPAGDPVPDHGRTAGLWPHVLSGWVFSPACNTRHLPRAARPRGTFALDTAGRLSELDAISQVLSWSHGGDIAPLLDRLAATGKPTVNRVLPVRDRAATPYHA